MTPIDILIDKITGRMAEIARRPFVVAIDGHSAAGKSTISNGLVAAWPAATLLRTDDFYRAMDSEARFALNAEEGFRQYYDWQRLLHEALEPLREGRPARFQTYDWGANTLGAWQEVPASPLVVVEGCYSARLEFEPVIDFVVLVEADAELRRQHQAARDDASTDWLARWGAAERHYIESTGLRQRADIVLQNA